MGAIKLIDLDQEIFVPIYDEAQGVTYEQIMTIGGMFDKFMGGYQPPIVDAIPVEWLEEQRKQCSHKWDVNFYESIQTVLTEWQKEQEAQDD